MPDTTATYEKGKLYDLPINDLKSDPNQPRKSMDPQALEELTASVQRVGIIQPLLFRVEIGGHDPIRGHDPNFVRNWDRVPGSTISRGT